MATGQATSLRDNHRYLDDAQWAYLEKMDAVSGLGSVHALLAPDPAVVVARITRFSEYEAAREKYVSEVVKTHLAAVEAAAPAPAPPTLSYVPPPACPEGPKSVRVAVSQYSGEEEENLVFWQRENELAIAAARISDERQKVTFAISNMTGRAKIWALTCETSHPGCFRDWATLVEAMKSIFQPPNVANRQRAAFLACVQGKRELFAFVQELRQLRASMAANALPEEVMLTVFMNNMNAGPAKAAVFREEPTTLERAFAVALREDYIQRLASSVTASPVVPSAAGCAEIPSTEQVDLSAIDLNVVDLTKMDLSAIDVNALHIKCFTCDKLGHFQRDSPRNRGLQGFCSHRDRGRGRRSGNRSAQASASTTNARPPPAVSTTDTDSKGPTSREDWCSKADKRRRVSGDLIVVTASVKGYDRSFKVLIDSGATRNYGRKQSIAENTALFAQACEVDRGWVSVRLATGIVTRTKQIETDLRVAFADFDSVEPFTVIDMDGRFDLILGMPWLESHEPWIDWRTKSIGSSSPGSSEVQARHEPSFAHRQVNSILDDGASMYFVGVVDTAESNGSASLITNAEVAPLIAEISTESVSQLAGSTHQSALGRSVESTPLPKTGKSTSGRRRRRKRLRDRRVAQKAFANIAPYDINVIDAVTGSAVDPATVDLAPLPEFSELTTLEELPMDAFVQELKAGEIAEVVILRSEREIAELNTSSVIDESVLIEFRQKFDARRGSAILKNPKDRYYQLVKRFADTCLSKEPPAGLPPDRGTRHEIKLKPGSTYATVLPNLRRRRQANSWPITSVQPNKASEDLKYPRKTNLSQTDQTG